MKNLLLTILLSALTSNSCYAAETIHLNTNDPAPFAGVLLSDKQAKVVYGELKDYDKVKLINKSLVATELLLIKNEVIYKSEISEVRDENVSLRTAVNDANKNSFWKNALYFSLGILTASAVVYATRSN
jgi:hypothetical protein